MGITDFGFLFHKVECPQAPKLPSSFSRKRVEKRPAGGRALGGYLLRVLDGGLCGGQTGDVILPQGRQATVYPQASGQ